MNIFRFEDYQQNHEFTADVVVIGTGAGGAVAGAILAEAGLDVIFAEEGSYTPQKSLGPYGTQSVPRLYRDASGTVIFGTPPIPYVEGRCVGGSTLINGGMTWRTPDDVLNEWVEITGANELGPAGLDSLFAEIEENICAAPQHPESVGEDNRLMARGAQKMGWAYKTNNRNQDTCIGANNCVMGCPTGAKQSTLVSYMPRAFRAGADCLTELRIDELLIENGKCVGVSGFAYHPHTRALKQRVRVRAKAVVVACGAVQTPFLLLKHGIGRPSGQLGKNFLCHPNAKVVAVYPHEVRAWQGVSQWTQIREFHDDGIILAENFVPPVALGAYLPFHGNKAWNLMKDYNRMVISGVLVEDSSSGEVKRGPFDLAMPTYDITDIDHRRFLKGITHLAEMHFANGAEKVVLPFTHLPMALTPDDLKKITQQTCPKKSLELFTVHLMGTARMGSRANESVVDLSGEMWDLPGCYVADASVFPTAIGVNPQVTIMALATRVARRLGEKLGSRRKVA